MLNLTEAFKSLDSLNEEAFDISTQDGVKELDDFLKGDDIAPIEVIDVAAEDEDDLEDSYVGKVILSCPVCKSVIYRDKEDIKLDDEHELANTEELCPYCHTLNGFKIVGQVEDFCDECEEDSEEDVEITESVNYRKKLKEAKNLSDKAGTLSSALKRHQDELSSFGRDTKKEDIVAFLDKISGEVTDKNYLEKTKQNVMRKRYLDDAVGLLYDIILKGDGEGVIKLKGESLKENDQAADVVSKYQKWVDYDMKKYGRISDITKKKLAKAGFEVVKDDHGDYEVIPAENMNEFLDVSASVPINVSANVDAHGSSLGFLGGSAGGIGESQKSCKTRRKMNEAIEVIENDWGGQDILDNPEDYDVMLGNEDEEDDDPVTHGPISVEDFIDAVCAGCIYEDEVIDSNDVKKFAFTEDGFVVELKDGTFRYLVDRGVGGCRVHKIDEDEFEQEAYGSYDESFKSCKTRRKMNESRRKKKGVVDKFDEIYSKLTRSGDAKLDIGRPMPYPHDNVTVTYDRDGFVGIQVKAPEDKLEFARNLAKEYNLDTKEKNFDKDNKILVLYVAEEDVGDTQVECLKEDFKDVTITTDDTHMEMTADEDGKVTVTTEPVKDDVEGEVIAPVDAELENDIDAENAEDEEEIDFNEIDDSIEDLGESYLKSVYDNVKSFKLSSGSIGKDSMMLEGVITFNSGKQVNTAFNFEGSSVTKRGKLRLIGENKQITSGKKAFMLTGKVEDNKFIAESLNYRYRAKDSKSGKSVPIYGTVRRSK